MSVESDVPVRRVYGSEVEYQYSLGENVGWDNHDKKTPSYTKSYQDFLENGARHYFDLLGLPEYATGGSFTIAGVVSAELTGEEIMADAYLHGNSKLQALHKRTSVLTQKRLSCSDPNYSTGIHENYATSLHLSSHTQEDLIFPLAGFNATRTIFTGSGRPIPNGYTLSQKMFDINSVSNSNTTRWKPLVNLRDEPHSNDSGIYRLHVTCGDANISPWVIRMKFGTYSLGLRLLEHGVNMRDLWLDDPVGAAKDVDSSIEEGLRKPLRLASGKTINAIDYQWEWANRESLLAEQIDIPYEEREVLYDYCMILDALGRFSKIGEIQDEMEKLDWVTKYELIQRKKEKTQEKHDAQLTPEEGYRVAKAVDVAYHLLPDKRYPDMSIGINMRRTGNRFASDTPSAESIEMGKTEPFRGGRDEIRGEFIKEMQLQDVNDRLDSIIDWEHVRFGRKGVKKSLPVTRRYTPDEVRQTLTELFAPYPLKGKYKDPAQE